MEESGDEAKVTKAAPAKGRSTTPVTIPAKYIRKLVKQAIAKQAGLTK